MKKAVIIFILLYLATLSADFPRPWEIVFYTNSTVAYCHVTIDGVPAAQGDEVGAFIADECRGVGSVINTGEEAITTMNIQGNVIEPVEFAVWDASEDIVCVVAYTTNTLPGGDIGYPPNLLPINAVSDPNQNLAPIWNLPEELSWEEDSNYSINLHNYASDPEGVNLIFSCTDNGDLTVNIIAGNAQMIPASNYFGTSEVVFSASDGENTSMDTVVVTVTSVNDAPLVFISDDFSFEEDTGIIIDLTGYVMDMDNDDLEITIMNNYHIDWSVEGMMLNLSADANWNGSENLHLTAWDGEASDSDNFLVIVTPVNDAPVLNLPAEVNFAEDGELIINLNNYASDPDGDNLNFSFTGEEYLMVSIMSNYLILSAETNWNGNEVIEITATDPALLMAADQLMVTVNAVNDAPVIVLPDDLSFEEDTVLSVDFGEYASDVDDDELSLLVSGNAYINVQMTGLMVNLSAAGNWWGEENLQFTVNDGQGRATDSDQVMISVVAVNDAPQINLPAELSFYTYSELIEDFSGYVSDPEGDEILLSVSGNTSIQVEIEGLNVTFSAEPGWFGVELMTFQASDGELTSEDNISVEVLELSDLPDLILPETISFNEDTGITRDFSNYIFNSEGFDLELTALGNELIEVGINGFEVSFSAPADWWGVEEISFEISDTGAGFETWDSVLVNVLPVNDAPQIDLPAEISFAEDTSYTLDCEEYISDIDNETLTLSVTDNEMILVGINGLILQLSALTNYNGAELLNVTVNDNSGRAIASDTLLVNVEAVNDAPVLNLPAEIIFNEDEVYEFDVYEYIYDVDNDDLDISFESDFGCQFNWMDDWVFLSAPENFNGSGVIGVSVTDGWENLYGEIAVTIIAVNDAPQLELPDTFSFNEDTIFIFDISDYAEDADEDNLQVTYSGPFFIFVEISGTIVELQPLSNWSGSANMNFIVNDGFLTDMDAVEIVVEPVNDMPVLNSFIPEETELLFYGETDIHFSVNVYDNDSDLIFDWSINGIDQNINDNEFDYTFNESGEYAVLVEINDEEYQISQEWQVTIYSGPGWQLVIYTNSTVAYSIVTIDDEPAEENDLLGAFVGGECRGIGEIVIVEGVSYSSFLIQGETVETVNFKVYSANDDAIYDVLYTTQTNPGGDLGNPPYDLLPLAAYTTPGPGWIPVDIYTEWTTAYTIVTINGEAAAAEDVVGAFDGNGQCLGVGIIEIVGDNAYSTIDVYQDEVVEFYFRVWDASFNAIYYDYTAYNTAPGAQIGAPGSEIEIAVSTTAGPGWIPVVYTNSTTGYFILNVNGEPAGEEDLLGVFVDDECRGIGAVSYYEDLALSTVEIQGEEVESCYFRLWDASLLQILSNDIFVETNPGGEIGYPPDEIELEFWSYELPEYQLFPRPWNVVYYTNSTVAYGNLTMDDEPVAAGNEVASFIEGECRGLANIVNTGEASIFTMNIQGDSPEPVQFNYYDVSVDEVYSIEYITITNPGGDIGYPPDLLQLTIYTNFAPEVNLPPGFSFDEDEVVTEDMSAYIWDPDGDELTIDITGNENINIEIEGLWVTAWGNANWFGIETVEYSIDDGHEHIVTGSLEIEVISVNDAPVVNLPYSFTLQEDQDLSVDFAMFISDIEGDAWTLSVSGAVNIVVSITGSMVTLHPLANWNGQESLTFSAFDGMDAGSDVLIVIVNPQPDAPVVNFPDELMIYENAFLVVEVDEYISDPEGDEFDVYGSLAEHITVNVVNDSIWFIPESDWFGSEVVTIFADDGTTRLVGSDEVEIVVEEVHQPPILLLPDQFILSEDVPETIDLTAYFWLFEGDEFTFLVTGNDSIMLDFNEADLTISAPENWFGTETVIFTLDDEPTRMTVSDTVNIVIEPVNDAPVLISFEPPDLELEVEQDTTITFTVTVEDVDSEVEYTWYINGIEQPGHEAGIVVLFDELGDFEVQCLASDEDEELSVTWNVTVIEVDNSVTEVITATGLTGNYPNPFNPETTISFSVKPEDLPAELLIYNLKGQIIRSWQIAARGNGRIVWNGCDNQGNRLASGVFIYCLRYQGGSEFRRMLMLK